jgi:transposase-like protein
MVAGKISPMIRKAEKAMRRLEPNNGNVEVDEAYVFGHRLGKTGRATDEGRAIVVAAVEDHGASAGRVRLRRVFNASATTLTGFIADHVEKGSTIITDGWAGYFKVGENGYKHVIREGETSKDVTEQLPHVHRVFSNLKAWLIGTHHGVSPKHLQTYLNEFTFRFNRRFNPMAAFHRMLGIATDVEGPTYRGLYRAGTDFGWTHRNPEE